MKSVRAVVSTTLCMAVAMMACAQTVEVRVENVDGLRQALQNAAPGTRILIAPGDYAGGISVAGLNGKEGLPITIQGEDPVKRPRFVGGGAALHMSRVSYVELRDLVVCGQTGNGLNLDDGGVLDVPTHHVVLENLTVSDVGPSGNRDGIKLSGLEDFVVRGCRIESWGDGGSGIDMVGCHRGRIEGCYFRARETGQGGGSNAVQAKGGSCDVLVRGNRFDQPGARGVNIGGSTGLQFFRPKPQGYEAKNITVEGNVFIGGMAPVAFVGVDGANVRFNTIYQPGRWALRILQETALPEFVPCRNGVFADNIIVFRSGQWSEGGCNVGPHTAPETFQFARNLWLCQDRPDLSKPTLPTPEQDGLYGVDPQFSDADRGDFALRPGSPATGYGHTAVPAG
jgi:hypothetical protein